VSSTNEFEEELRKEINRPPVEEVNEILIDFGSFKLPLERVQEGVVIIGNRGFGKSYTMGLILEQFCKLGVKFIHVDPQEANTNLRSYCRNVYVQSVFSPSKILKAFFVRPRLSIVLYPRTIDFYDNCEELFRLINRVRARKYVKFLTIDEFHQFKQSEELSRLTLMKRSEGWSCIFCSQRLVNLNTDVAEQQQHFILHRLRGKRDLEFVRDALLNLTSLDKSEIKQKLKRLSELRRGECMLFSDYDPSQRKEFYHEKVKRFKNDPSGNMVHVEGVREPTRKDKKMFKKKEKKC